MKNNNTMMYGFKSNKNSSWVYKLFLFLSFIWVSAYPAITSVSSDFYFNYGNIFMAGSSNFSYVLTMVIVEALVSWIFFEIVFYLYTMIYTRGCTPG